MENMLLIGLSRQVTLERQLDVVANNMANVNTNGFKADKSLFEQFLRTGASDEQFARPDRNVSFVQDRATMHDFAPGPNEQTKAPLDVAIDGKGFLAVRTPAGERYTRDGNLQINAQGQLVTASGYPVLGTSGPINFQPGDREITIAADGNITVMEGTNRIDSVRAKLRLVEFAQPQLLEKSGGNLYAAGTGAVAAPSTTSRINQGFIEKSNVNTVMEMSRLMDVTRSYTKISDMLKQQGDLRRTAIEKLADVPA